MDNLNPRQRISDNLSAEVAPGRTVQTAIDERFGRVEPDERRTKRGIVTSTAGADATSASAGGADDAALFEALAMLEPHRPQPAIGVAPGGLLPSLGRDPLDAETVVAELVDIEPDEGPDEDAGVEADEDLEDFEHDA